MAKIQTMWKLIILSLFIITQFNSVTGTMEAENILPNVRIRAVKLVESIRLNITWDTSYQDEESEIGFEIKPTESCCNNCSTNVPYLLENNYNISKGFLVKPLETADYPVEEDQFRPNCSYDITISRLSTTDQSISSQVLRYQVPECVENICTCTKNNIKLINCTYKSKDTFTVHFIANPHVSLYALRYKTLFNYFKNRTNETKSSSFTIKSNNSVDIFVAELQKFSLYADFLNEFYNTCEVDKSNTITCEVNYSLIHKKRNTTFLIMFASALIIMVIMILTIWCYRKKKRNEIPKPPPRQKTNPIYEYDTAAIYQPRPDPYEFPRSRLDLGEEIDRGTFGRVFKAKAHGINNNPGVIVVAVKQLIEGARGEEKEDFKKEIELFKKIGQHTNIIRLLGCCTLEEPLMMIMEMIPDGSLHKYLTGLKKLWDRRKLRNQQFFPEDMVEDWLDSNKKNNQPNGTAGNNSTTGSSSASYILPDNQSMENANYPKRMSKSWKGKIGTKNEENKRLIPHYLKLNNTVSVSSSCLSSSPETIVTPLDLETPSTADNDRQFYTLLSHVELQNFALQVARGMEHLEKQNIAHRDLATRNVLMGKNKVLKISDFGMSRTGTYVICSNKKMPLRWMALEALETRMCNSKSDVWSFGVVLWEIGNLGGYPYDTMPNERIIPYLQGGGRLTRPPVCTSKLYELMLQCWSANPDQRPTFESLVDKLELNADKVYLNFRSINPAHNFPSTSECISYQ